MLSCMSCGLIQLTSRHSLHHHLVSSLSLQEGQESSGVVSVQTGGGAPTTQTFGAFFEPEKNDFCQDALRSCECFHLIFF